MGDVVIGASVVMALFLGGQDVSSGAAVPPAARSELNFFPLVGGDSDIGFGGGVAGDLARLDPRYQPYRWRLELTAITTFKPGQAQGTGTGVGDVTIPYQDYVLDFDMPQLTASRRLRLELRPSFTWESTLRNYGIGNASQRPAEGVPLAQMEYARRHAVLMESGRMGIAGPFFLRFSAEYTQTWLQIPEDTILGRERANGAPRVRAL